MNRYTWRTAGVETVMVAAGLIFLVPVYILFNLAFRSANVLSSALSLTTQPTLKNFSTAWQTGGLGSAMLNSVMITAISVVAIVIVAALASYPLARWTSKWSTGLYMFFMIGLLLPYQLIFIPLYQTFAHLGLLGLWSLMILYIGHQAPFSIFLYTSFLRALPTDYEDAASLDGCGRFQTFRYVVFPLLGPVTGTVVILNLIFIWNDFMTPLLYLEGSGRQTLPVALYSFVGTYTTDWSTIFAGLIVSMVPVLIAYFALQSRIMKGFAGGLKG
jgi:raffinose/stachyose/melibiose transport system permease protein